MTRVPIEYVAAKASEPLRMSLWVSRAKLEKVVKPPNNPVTKSGWTHCGWWALIQPAASPMQKQPIKLQLKTPQGNP